MDIDGPGAMRSTVVHKSENYGDAEFLEQQPRLTDLIPRRGWTLAAVFVLGLAAIGGLGALYVAAPELAPQPDGGRLAMLDLAAPGSLAHWFSSLMLLAAGLTAVLIYTIRRHKVDDYQGRYRIWMWAATCFFLLATDSAAGLHDGLREVMTAVSGSRLMGDGTIWWAAPAAFLFAAVGARLLVDMWQCRGSSAAAILAVVCYAAALAAPAGWIGPDGAAGLLWDQGARLIGQLLMLLAMALHARHVILDAEGRLPRRRPAPKAEAAGGAQADADEGDGESRPSGQDADDGRSTPDRWVAVDPPHGTAQPCLRRVDSSGVPVAAPAPSPPASPSTEHKLTKAERKALKKRLLEQRMQRQGSTASGWGK
jgi:hypothetical protein